MKVLFLQNVPKIGKKHEVKDVADGFAYNNLIPRKLAVPATAEHVKKAHAQQASQKERGDKKESTLRGLAEDSALKPLVIFAAANEKGHLFKGVHVSDIIAAVHTRYGVALEERDILFSGVFKDLGMQTILVQTGGFKGEVSISIEAKK